MTNEELIQYWKVSAADAFDTAKELNRPGKYHHCLFFLHLAIEKMLKAVYVRRQDKTPPTIHDLVRIAEGAGFLLDEKRTRELVEISSFNISARYDDYKLQFYKKATGEYAKKWLEIGKKIYEEMGSLL